MEQAKKYSIVSYLEGEHCDKIRALQTKMFELTGSRACLNAWEPHITVGSGIWVTDTERAEVEEIFKQITENGKSFPLPLKGFGGRTDRKQGIGEVTTPYVLWVDVEVNQDLRNLVKTIEDTVTTKYKLWWNMPEPYAPHATVAFRDLTKEGHTIGEKFLKEQSFEDIVQISHIALVENLPEKDVEYKRFYFGK